MSLRDGRRSPPKPGNKHVLRRRDAVAKAHGVPTSLLPEDWTSMMLAFRNKFGRHIPDEKLPAQSCYEAFADKLAIGALKAEPLAMVVSLYDEELQERN